MRTTETHGATKGGRCTPEYLSWRAMRQRCTDPNGTGFENYGGRGITICERWANFENFLADMGPRPNITDSIDRIDNDGNYEPGNCRWATKTEQNQKKRSLHLLTVDGETTFLAEWSRRFGVPEATLWRRVIKLGWGHAKAVKTPVGAIRRRPTAIVMLTVDGVTRSLLEWSAVTGIDYSTLYVRVGKYGWDPKRAVTEAVVRGGRRVQAA